MKIIIFLTLLSCGVLAQTPVEPPNSVSDSQKVDQQTKNTNPEPQTEKISVPEEKQAIPQTNSEAESLDNKAKEENVQSLENQQNQAQSDLNQRNPEPSEDKNLSDKAQKASETVETNNLEPKVTSNSETEQKAETQAAPEPNSSDDIKNKANKEKNVQSTQPQKTKDEPVEAQNPEMNSNIESELFKTNFENYIRRAKELSKKQMTDNDVSELIDKAMTLINDLRTRAIHQKLKAENINLKYLDGKDFPEISEHQGNSETDQRIVKFTIACYSLHKTITKELVQKIISKSPLEMVSIIKELSVFYQFISANPKDFGHGQFTERQENAVNIFATNDAILRIMKGIIYKNLLNNKKVYKMSRLGTFFYNGSETDPSEFASSLKRSCADDSRISIYIPEATIELSIDDSETNELRTVAYNYLKELNLSRNAKDKEEQKLHEKKAIELAKSLLGIVANVKINTSAKVTEFSRILEQKISELEKAEESSNEKETLKKKRDIANYKQIESFIKSNSKLFDSLYSNPEIFNLIMQKLPDFVPVIGREITVFLRSLGLIIESENNFDKVISLLRDFARTSSDGTYLLSPINSIATANTENLDMLKLLQNTDFTKYDVCKYLKLK